MEPPPLLLRDSMALSPRFTVNSPPSLLRQPLVPLATLLLTPLAPPTTCTCTCWQVKLDALKAETKFTESCQIVKFAGSNTIHSGVLRISDIRRTSMVSQIHLYCNNKPVNDVGELKNRWELWKRVKTLTVPPAQAEIRFDFAIPVSAGLVASTLDTPARPTR